ncbi:hypothetical protein GQ53DRAFT_751416 [Thozetella sp. PMI_491]|nr:hypothetical protein GQ53DRAFT_751416 [Thozetella sp. PMI_491]
MRGLKEPWLFLCDRQLASLFFTSRKQSVVFRGGGEGAGVSKRSPVARPTHDVGGALDRNGQAKPPSSTTVGNGGERAERDGIARGSAPPTGLIV